MDLILFGTSHENAPVGVRERLSFSKEEVLEFLPGLSRVAGVSECLVLSTCNRIEVYAVCEDGLDGSVIARALFEFKGIDAGRAGGFFYTLNSQDAVKHLFGVSAGLKSQVLGENQIQGQVKGAYSLAVKAKTAGPLLHRLLHTAFRAGKRVRSETNLNSGAVSVSRAAVELASHVYEDLSGKSALLIGAGEAGELSASYLKERGISKLSIANRTRSNAERLASVYGAEVVDFESIAREFFANDIVISATGGQGYVISHEMQKPLRGGSPSRRTVVIDISVPRSIDPAMAKYENIFLYDMDDLKGIVDKNLEERRSSIPRAERIVSSMADEHEKQRKRLMKNRIIIGSRKSKLALFQANLIKGLIEERFGDIEVVIRTITTRGDMALDKPLPEIGDKGFFTKEIEDALISGEIDLAVHSLKDMPVELSAGLAILSYSAREECRDCLVSRDGKRLGELEAGAVVGTSSLRRSSQLLRLRPDLRIVDLRGNVETRLKKLETENMDAIVLAAAGLIRLGFADRIAELLETDVMTPAAGQGIIAVEAKSGRKDLAEILSGINDSASEAAAVAERALLFALGGGCRAPIGAVAEVDGDEMELCAFAGSIDGKEVMRDNISGPKNDAAGLGGTLARRMLDGGAARIIERARHE